MDDLHPSNGHIDPGTIQWIFFDFDGTLRHNKPDGLTTLHQFVEEQGVSIPEATRRQAFRWNHSYWASSPLLKQDAKEAGDELEQLYLRYTRRYLEQLDLSQEFLDDLTPVLHQRMSSNYEPKDHVPAEVPGTLQSLLELGYSLALISNRSKPLEKQVADLGLDEYFEFILAAGEVGWWKPDPQLLQHAAELAGIEPAQAVYIGDNPFADVAGARSAGLQPILFDPARHYPEVNCPSIVKLAELVDMLDPAK